MLFLQTQILFDAATKTSVPYSLKPKYTGSDRKTASPHRGQPQDKKNYVADKNDDIKPLTFYGMLMSYNSSWFANTQKVERFGYPIHANSWNRCTYVQNMNDLLSQAGTFLSRHSIFSKFV